MGSASLLGVLSREIHSAGVRPVCVVCRDRLGLPTMSSGSSALVVGARLHATSAQASVRRRREVLGRTRREPSAPAVLRHLMLEPRRAAKPRALVPSSFILSVASARRARTGLSVVAMTSSLDEIRSRDGDGRPRQCRSSGRISRVVPLQSRASSRRLLSRESDARLRSQQLRATRSREASVDRFARS